MKKTSPVYNFINDRLADESAEIRYLLLEQKKFQNKSKNIDKVYRLVSFRCIMPLSYRVTFLCNVVCKLIIHQKALYDIFYEKVVKWCKD